MHSKLINTRQITQMLKSKLYATTDMELSIDDLLEEVVVEDKKTVVDNKEDNIENSERLVKVKEMSQKKTELITQLEIEKAHFASLQKELDASGNKIQQLEAYINELEAQIQQPPK